MVRLNEFKLRFQLTGRLSWCYNCNRDCYHECEENIATFLHNDIDVTRYPILSCDNFIDDGRKDNNIYKDLKWKE